MKFWNRPKKEKIKKSFVREWSDAIVFAVVMATLIRWSVVEAYVIPTPSMENSMLVGDYLFVSKFHYGTRTPQTPLELPLMHQKIWGTEIPSYLPWIKLPTYRLPGISEVRREDIVVFHVPPVSQNKGESHPIDQKTNYVKRCVGIAGDIIEVKNRQVYANGQPLADREGMKFSYIVTSADEINARNLRSLELDKWDYYFWGRTDEGKAVYKMFLTKAQAEEVKSLSYVSSIILDFTRGDRPDPKIWPQGMAGKWNADNYGPLWIPKKGVTIEVNDSTMIRYGEMIELYEKNENVKIAGGKLSINGQPVTQYEFKQDYYFMMGDNRHDSEDSRYWGFVPEDHIVGKALFIWMSLDEEANLLNKIRWQRLFNIIK